MYVHIGGEYSISDRFIICVIDMESISPSQSDMLSFLAEAEKSDHVEYVSDDIPQSAVITVDRVYFSPLSTATLFKRMTEKRAHGYKSCASRPL